VTTASGPVELGPDDTFTMPIACAPGATTAEYPIRMMNLNGRPAPVLAFAVEAP
jgi:hypothetical protein